MNSMDRPPSAHSNSSAGAGPSAPLSRPVSTSYLPVSTAQSRAATRPRQRPTVWRQPSVRLRGFPSQATPEDVLGSSDNATRTRPAPPSAEDAEVNVSGGRRRSSSEPQRPTIQSIFATNPTGTGATVARTAGGAPGAMPAVVEEIPTPQTPQPLARVASTGHVRLPVAADAGNPGVSAAPQNLLAPPPDAQGRFQRAGATASAFLNPRRLTRSGLFAAAPAGSQRRRSVGSDNPEFESSIVDLLDVVDPEVSTLSTLTNVQNSLFIPDLGPLLNRRPTYTLTRRPEATEDLPQIRDVHEKPSPVAEDLEPEPEPEREHPTEEVEKAHQEGKEIHGESEEVLVAEHPDLTPLTTISSRLTESRYAVLPHGKSLEGWSATEKAELNDHVRHMLHSRRSKIKRGFKGFLQYISRPLGFLVFFYALSITVFGLVWVLFLIGWISVGGRRDYDINVIDNVLVALFAIIGDGLAPFRAIDTYHMIYIAHYHHLTWRLRRQKALPKLHNRNDLPARRPSDAVDTSGTESPPEEQLKHEFGDPEAQFEKHQGEFSVLTPKQQEKLRHHQTKFAKSHTFYKPHETETHTAFPLNLLVAVVVLLDCHSMLQIALGTCTWSISYHVRPFALTTVILCCSITCNITAGVLISVGDHRTRKKDVIERMFRQELTEHAMKRIHKRKEKQEKKERELEREASENAELSRKSTDFTRKSTDLARRTTEAAKKSLDVVRKGSDNKVKTVKTGQSSEAEGGKKEG